MSASIVVASYCATCLTNYRFFRYTERNHKKKKNCEINFVLVQREGLYHGAVITQYSQDGTNRRVRIFQKFHDPAQQNDSFFHQKSKKQKQTDAIYSRRFRLKRKLYAELASA
jgi:hypothetical protein